MIPSRNAKLSKSKNIEGQFIPVWTAFLVLLGVTQLAFAQSAEEAKSFLGDALLTCEWYVDVGGYSSWQIRDVEFSKNSLIISDGYDFNYNYRAYIPLNSLITFIDKDEDVELRCPNPGCILQSGSWANLSENYFINCDSPERINNALRYLIKLAPPASTAF